MLCWRFIACVALFAAALDCASWVETGHPALVEHEELGALGRWLSGGMSIMFSLACLRVAIMGTDGTWSRRPPTQSTRRT